MRAALLTLLLLAACAPADRPAPTERIYETRGIYHGPRFDGEAASVEHEAIPDVMEAMRMDLRLEDPAELDRLTPGDRVRFDLVVRGSEVRARHFERLPDTTRLVLPEASAY
jgi:Cu/Ag efflux protein CusF